MGKINVAQLSRKDIYVGIKNHMSIDDFCKTYSIEKDQFKETIKQIFATSRTKSCVKSPRTAKSPKRPTDANDL